MPAMLKVCPAIVAGFVLVSNSLAQTTPEGPLLAHKLLITPEIKKAFHGSDMIDVLEVTGTAANFQVGGTYRVIGTCRQETVREAALLVGNSAEAGAKAIAPAGGSALTQALPTGSSRFDYTFTLLRPGILHITIYDMSNRDKADNAYAGVYLGDVVFKR